MSAQAYYQGCIDKIVCRRGAPSAEAQCYLADIAKIYQNIIKDATSLDYVFSGVDYAS